MQDNQIAPRPPTGMELWYLGCLRVWVHKRPSPPTVRELARWVKKSKTAVHEALQSLTRKGLVRLDKSGRYTPVVR